MGMGWNYGYGTMPLEGALVKAVQDDARVGALAPVSQDESSGAELRHRPGVARGTSAAG